MKIDPARLVQIVGIAVCVVLVLGCGGAPPEILFAEAQLFLFDDLTSGTVGESLRLFVAVRDSDGVEDLSVLSIVHDESELFWQVSSEGWVEVESDGDSWIGIPDIRPVSGSFLPRGRYRLVLEDQSLQETESSFSITAPQTDPRGVVFPRLESQGVVSTIIAEGPVVMRVLTRDGRVALSREVSSGLIPESLLRELPDESGLTVYLTTPAGEPVRLLSGPYDLPR